LRELSFDICLLVQVSNRIKYNLAVDTFSRFGYRNKSRFRQLKLGLELLQRCRGKRRDCCSHPRSKDTRISGIASRHNPHSEGNLEHICSIYCLLNSNNGSFSTQYNQQCYCHEDGRFYTWDRPLSNMAYRIMSSRQNYTILAYIHIKTCLCSSHCRSHIRNRAGHKLFQSIRHRTNKNLALWPRHGHRMEN